jgi:hypothetical protein
LIQIKLIPPALKIPYEKKGSEVSTGICITNSF